MRKSVVFLPFVFTLSACGGGSSGDGPASNNASVVAVAESGEMSVESTGMPAVSTQMPAESVEMPAESVDQNNNSGTSLTQYGFVFVDITDTVEFSAGFNSFQQPLPQNLFQEEFGPARDTCEVTSVSLIPDGGIPGFPDGIPDDPDNIGGVMFTTISAGEVLTVSSPAGSYAELQRSQQFGFTFYSIDEELELSAPAPGNLSISVPGDEFPAFTNVDFPVVEPLLVSAPGASEAVTANTSFRWTGSTNPNSLIDISASALSDDFMSLTFLDCEVVDDGSFEFPADTRAALGSFSSDASIERTAFRIVQQGSSALILSVGVERTTE